MDLIGTRLDIAQKLKEYVEAKRNKNGTAVSAAFIKDGELVSAFACGTQDGNSENPATTDDLFAIGSVSKVYCTLAIMKLVEMGKVTLDTSVVEYLPRFTMKDERYKQITLRMLLNHSSGMPGTNLKYCFQTKWITGNIYNDFYSHFANTRLINNPGNTSVYSNDGYMLLEMVIVEVTGMSYIKFVQDYITMPAGALSTCSFGNILENCVCIKEKGKVQEYLMNLAAGGILTNLSDCAKIGYLFIDSKSILMNGSLDETTLSKGKSFIPGVAENFGLGWHSKNFAFGAYDFGEYSVMAGGGTLSFGAALIVSKKYNFAAAVSLTHDNRVDFTILCELCSIFLDEYGIETRKKHKESAAKNNKVIIPEEMVTKYSGMYYSCMRSFRVNFTDDLLTIQFRKPIDWENWGNIVTDAVFNGQFFVSGDRKFSFTEYGDNIYLIEEDTLFWGRTPMGQKCTFFPPINAAWKERVGKKYIVCDAHPSDYILNAGGFHITVTESENENGLLLFDYKGPFIRHLLPVVTAGDNETEMVINAPLQGSRENFAPYIYEIDGIEYLYAFGYNLIDTAYLKPLQTGRIISQNGRQNKVFSITAGSKIKVDMPNDVRVIIFDSDLKQIYDSASGQEINETRDGYILFTNENSMDFSVEVVQNSAFTSKYDYAEKQI